LLECSSSSRPTTDDASSGRKKFPLAQLPDCTGTTAKYKPDRAATQAAPNALFISPNLCRIEKAERDPDPAGPGITPSEAVQRLPRWSRTALPRNGKIGEHVMPKPAKNGDTGIPQCARLMPDGKVAPGQISRDETKRFTEFQNLLFKWTIPFDAPGSKKIWPATDWWDVDNEGHWALLHEKWKMDLVSCLDDATWLFVYVGGVFDTLSSPVDSRLRGAMADRRDRVIIGGIFAIWQRLENLQLCNHVVGDDITRICVKELGDFHCDLGSFPSAIAASQTLAERALAMLWRAACDGAPQVAYDGGRRLPAFDADWWYSALPALRRNARAWKDPWKLKEHRPWTLRLQKEKAFFQPILREWWLDGSKHTGSGLGASEPRGESDIVSQLPNSPEGWSIHAFSLTQWAGKMDMDRRTLKKQIKNGRLVFHELSPRKFLAAIHTLPPNIKSKFQHK
jgi:hypothetical protein